MHGAIESVGGGVGGVFGDGDADSSGDGGVGAVNWRENGVGLGLG